MTIRVSIVTFALLMLLILLSSGCGKGASAGENPGNTVLVNQEQVLPGWLLPAHRGRSLSDEQLGFVVKETEYSYIEDNVEDEKDDLKEFVEETTSPSTIKGFSAGSASDNSEDEWESSIITPPQSTNSGSWWEEPFSNDSGSTGQMEHKVRYDLED